MRRAAINSSRGASSCAEPKTPISPVSVSCSMPRSWSSPRRSARECASSAISLITWGASAELFFQLVQSIEENLGVARRRQRLAGIAEGAIGSAILLGGKRIVEQADEGAEFFQALAGFVDRLAANTAIARGELRQYI